MPAIPKEKQVATTVTPKTLERIDREADAREISRAEFIRYAVMTKLSEIESRNQEA